MPRQVSEVSSGAQFSRSSEEGRVADTQTRTFKVLMSEVGEYLNIQEACGIYIGDAHPANTDIFCKSFDARYDGESRMVILCTFQYGTTAGSDGGGQDPKSVSPDVRPANWSTSTSLVEMPAREWYEVDDNGDIVPINFAGDIGKVPAKNPADDIYDGITYMMAMMTITIDQYEVNDPTKHVELAGCVNLQTLNIGSLACAPRTIMFRGVSFKPTVEAWGDLIFRGWVGTYEFLYKQDTWDVRVPLTGFSVYAFNPNGARADQDPYGQPLAHSSQGKIITAPLMALPETVTDGEKVRAMVRVFAYENGGASQLPSAQPIPLNTDGTPRKGAPLVKRYCPYRPIDMATSLGLRLY